MNGIRLYRNLLVILFFDILSICFSYFSAYLVRFDFRLSPAQYDLILKTLPMVLSVKILFFFLFNLYRGMWRFTSIRDVMNIFTASVVSFSFIVGTLLIYNRFIGFSRSVFIMDLCFTILTIAGSRLVVRMFYEHSDNLFSKEDEPKPKRLLIIGAGSMGEKIFRSYP